MTDPAKPRLATTLVGSVVVLTIVMGLTQAVTNQADGVPMGQALLAVYGSSAFWLDLMVPLIVLVVGFQLLWGPFWKWIARPSSKAAVRFSAFNRVRLISTAGFVTYATAILYGIYKQSAQGVPWANIVGNSLGLIYVVVLAFFVLLIWVRPSAEKAKALDSGDYSRINDERHAQVVMRSAQSTVLLALGGILVVGSLAEMLFFRSMPIRSFAAAALLLVVWQLLYIYWDKRM